MATSSPIPEGVAFAPHIRIEQLDPEARRAAYELLRGQHHTGVRFGESFEYEERLQAGEPGQLAIDGLVAFSVSIGRQSPYSNPEFTPQYIVVLPEHMTQAEFLDLCVTEVSVGLNGRAMDRAGIEGELLTRLANSREIATGVIRYATEHGPAFYMLAVPKSYESPPRRDTNIDPQEYAGDVAAQLFLIFGSNLHKRSEM